MNDMITQTDVSVSSKLIKIGGKEPWLQICIGTDHY